VKAKNEIYIIFSYAAQPMFRSIAIYFYCNSVSWIFVAKF